MRYPKFFGGTWSTSPDSSVFDDFCGIDLYAANANVYRKPDGSSYPIMRDKGKVQASFEPVSYTHLDVYKRQSLLCAPQLAAGIHEHEIHRRISA